MQNLQQVIGESGYELKNILRLNVYTTSNEQFTPRFEIRKEWIAKNVIRQALRLFQATELFETLKTRLKAAALNKCLLEKSNAATELLSINIK